MQGSTILWLEAYTWRHANLQGLCNRKGSSERCGERFRTCLIGSVGWPYLCWYHFNENNEYKGYSKLFWLLAVDIYSHMKFLWFLNKKSGLSGVFHDFMKKSSRTVWWKVQFYTCQHVHAAWSLMRIFQWISGSSCGPKQIILLLSWTLFSSLNLLKKDLLLCSSAVIRRKQPMQIICICLEKPCLSQFGWISKTRPKTQDLPEFLLDINWLACQILIKCGSWKWMTWYVINIKWMFIRRLILDNTWRLW